MTPLVLGIETATALGSVAVVSPAGLLGELTLLGAESHAERILPAAEHLLAALGFTARDLAAVAVSSGPGSFTGLRTGVAAAKGLAFALGVPLHGVPTLATLAANAVPGTIPVAALLPARRGEVFCALYRHGAAGPEPLADETVVPVPRLRRALPRRCIVIGAQPPELREPAAARGLLFAPPHLNHPRAAIVAERGCRLALAGAPSELAGLLPRYLRPPDATARPPRRVAAPAARRKPGRGVDTPGVFQ